MKTLGEAIFEYRVRNDLTQAAVAEKLGISRDYLCEIENGRRPGKKTMKKLQLFILKENFEKK